MRSRIEPSRSLRIAPRSDSSVASDARAAASASRCAVSDATSPATASRCLASNDPRPSTAPRRPSSQKALTASNSAGSSQTSHSRSHAERAFTAVPPASSGRSGRT